MHTPVTPRYSNLMTQKPRIRTEIEISAPCALVWKVMTDFPGYASWNPFIRRIGGSLAVGERLWVFALLPCGLPMPLRPRVLECQVEREIKWLGSLIVSGLLDGEHLFMMESIGKNRARFVQSEEYSGALLPIMWS